MWKNFAATSFSASQQVCPVSFSVGFWIRPLWIFFLSANLTSGQSNLTDDCIAATDKRFNRICHVAPMCPPIWAHWCHLANTVELVLPSALSSPQLKRQIDRFSHSCTAQGRVPSATLVPPSEYNWNCAHWHNLVNMIELVLPSAHLSAQPNRNSIGSAVSTQLKAESLYTLQ